MIKIDETFVDAAAPNSAAISNGKDVLKKGKVIVRHVDAEETILFGECLGSGKSNYATSVDFGDPANPVYRCSCPSRQFPCKHALGLMYAWVRKDKPFTVKDVPEDIQSKREKAKVRAEKKQERVDVPKKVNLGALSKRIDAQLEGLDLLEMMTHDLIRAGLGTMNAKTARQLEERAKSLGDAYLPGAQAALRSLTTLFAPSLGADPSAQRHGESVYTEALDRLTRLQAICKRGREYLAARKGDPEMKPDTESTIAEWLGHAWQLAELKEHGLFQQQVELVQLSFCSYDDPARREFVDLAAWINLSTGAIQLTRNLRPYQAARHIKEDDCFFQVKQIPELYIYPGDMNPRVRWSDATMREIAGKDYSTILEHARPSLAEALKAVKAQLKDPLADKNPFLLVRYRSICQVNGQTILEDAEGERIALVDDASLDGFETVHLLNIVDPKLITGQAMLLRLIPDLDTMTLRAMPLTIVSADQILRLAL